MFKAQNLDGVRVIGYVAASLMDSFEWLRGYTVGFGLHHVDFTDPNRPRTPKYSAHFYQRVIQNNGFPLTDDERPLYGHFRDNFIWSTATASYQVLGTVPPCGQSGELQLIFPAVSVSFTVSLLINSWSINCVELKYPHFYCFPDRGRLESGR